MAARLLILQLNHTANIVHPLVHLRKLPRSFYLRPTIMVAKDLLGMFMVRRVRRHWLIGKIVEVEAYLSEKDPASHAYRGKTKRNEVMFWKGGYLYVYFTYGMHFCSNVVTEREGKGRAVLLRAVEPVEGKGIMKRNRMNEHKAGNRTLTRNTRRSKSNITNSTLLNLCSGPARLCQAFGITRKENGIDLCGTKIWIARNATEQPQMSIGTSTRVGVNNGGRNHWRFYIKDSPFVSKGKPAAG